MLRSAPGWVVALVAGLLLFGGAAVYHQVMAGRIEERVASGRAVAATVVDTDDNRGFPDRAVVRYRVGSRSYRVTLNALFPAPDYASGQRVVVYTDPTNRTRVGTAEGYTSESWWLLVPPLPVGVAGAVIAAVAASQPSRRRWEARSDRDPAPEDPDGPAVGERERYRPGGAARFDRVRRGYDNQDVQTFIRWFERVLASDDPQEWGRAWTALRLTTFRTQFWGNDPEQVHRHLAGLEERLRRVSGGTRPS